MDELKEEINSRIEEIENNIDSLADELQQLASKKHFNAHMIQLINRYNTEKEKLKTLKEILYN